MPIEILSDLDMSNWEEPEPTAESRKFLDGWPRYQRHEFLRKLRDLTPESLVAWSVPPLELSVLGLVRHMTQMEHFYLRPWSGAPLISGANQKETIRGDHRQTHP